MLAMKSAAFEKHHAPGRADEFPRNGDSRGARTNDANIRLESFGPREFSKIANHLDCFPPPGPVVSGAPPDVQQYRVLAVIDPLIVIPPKRAEKNLAAAIAVQFNTEVPYTR